MVASFYKSEKCDYYYELQKKKKKRLKYINHIVVFYYNLNHLRTVCDTCELFFTRYRAVVVVVVYSQKMFL